MNCTNYGSAIRIHELLDLAMTALVAAERRLQALTAERAAASTGGKQP